MGGGNILLRKHGSRAFFRAVQHTYRSSTIMRLVVSQYSSGALLRPCLRYNRTGRVTTTHAASPGHAASSRRRIRASAGATAAGRRRGWRRGTGAAGRQRIRAGAGRVLPGPAERLRQQVRPRQRQGSARWAERPGTQPQDQVMQSTSAGVQVQAGPSQLEEQAGPHKAQQEGASGKS